LQSSLSSSSTFKERLLIYQIDVDVGHSIDHQSAG
jgi:hypothetical protein